MEVWCCSGLIFDVCPDRVQWCFCVPVFVVAGWLGPGSVWWLAGTVGWLSVPNPNPKENIVI